MAAKDVTKATKVPTPEVVPTNNDLVNQHGPLGSDITNVYGENPYGGGE
jgi:hypothetical protein